MLAPHEFTVGTIGDAADMTLVLPRSPHEATMLITHAPDAPTAVHLDGQFRFASMNSAGNTSWGGVLVPNVSLEVDHTSIADPDIGRPLGALIRKHTMLYIVAAPDGGRGRQTHVPLISGLPPCNENESAGFTRWRIMLGEGLNRRVVKTIDAVAARNATT